MMEKITLGERREIHIEGAVCIGGDMEEHTGERERYVQWEIWRRGVCMRKGMYMEISFVVCTGRGKMRMGGERGERGREENVYGAYRWRRIGRIYMEISYGCLYMGEREDGYGVMEGER